MTFASDPKHSTDSKDYQCNICGRTFDSIETLNCREQACLEGYQPPAGVG
jgi:hypothetical protein